MKRFLLRALITFLLEVLILSLLSDRPALAKMMPSQDQALTVALWSAFPLALLWTLFAKLRGRNTGKRSKPRKSNKSDQPRKSKSSSKSNTGKNKTGARSSNPMNAVKGQKRNA